MKVSEVLGQSADTLRTMARSREIEAGEQVNIRRPPTRSANSFTDDPEDQVEAATLIQDDQIDFLDNEGDDLYRDDVTDDDDDVFRYKDGDEEEVITHLDKQPLQR